MDETPEAGGPKDIPLKLKGKLIGTSYIGHNGVLYSTIDRSLLTMEEGLMLFVPNLSDFDIEEINLLPKEDHGAVPSQDSSVSG